MSRMLTAAFNAGVDAGASEEPKHLLGGQLVELRLRFEDEQRGAWDAYAEVRLERLRNAVGALPRALPLNRSGSTECPNCGGRLHYARWHRGVEVQCDTANCCGARFAIEAGKDWPA